MPEKAEHEVRVYGEVSVYKSPDRQTWSVADGGGWYPGIYASEAAALFAPQVDIAVLEQRTRWQVRGYGDAYRPITLDELHQWCTAGDTHG